MAKEKALPKDGQAKPEQEEDKEIKDTSRAIARSVVTTPDDVQKQVDNTEKMAAILGDFIKRNLKPGIDYGIIEYRKKDGTQVRTKPFLHKPGSEKFAMLFNHRPKFLWIKQDFDKGIFAAKCVLINRKNEEIVGEGYGAARVSEKTSWTENEAMKMACKRAQIDAALRTYGLSEHFTQDEEAVTRSIQKPAYRSPVAPARPQQRQQYGGGYQKPTDFAPRNPNLPISPAQNRMIFALARDIKVNQDKLEQWIFDMSGIEGIENLTMGWSSKIITALKKRLSEKQDAGLETIQVDENLKRESDIAIPEPPEGEVEPPEDWENEQENINDDATDEL